MTKSYSELYEELYDELGYIISERLSQISLWMDKISCLNVDDQKYLILILENAVQCRVVNKIRMLKSEYGD